MKRLWLSLPLVALLLLLTNIPTASDCAPPLEIGVKPLPPEVSAILSVHGGEVLVSEDGTITVTNPEEPPKRFQSGAAILQHPWGAELRKNTSNYGTISHMRAGPLHTGNGNTNSSVSSIFVWAFDAGATWWIEVGFAYNAGCNCWGIFYATNGWPTEDNPNDWYQAFVGPTPPYDWHDLGAFRDSIDPNGYNVTIDGWMPTRLPLRGGNPADVITVGTSHVWNNVQLLSAFYNTDYYTSPGGAGRTHANPDWCNVWGTYPRYHPNTVNWSFNISGPTYAAPPPGC